MKKNFTLLLLLAVLTSTLKANNLIITNLTITGKNTTDHYSLVQFDISWENSWRTSTEPNNWDAAWVFVKYRVAGGEWQQAWLNENGHTVSAGSTIMPGLLDPGSAFNTTTNPGLGAFIYRSVDGTGTFTNNGVQLRWNYGANGVTDADVVEIKVFAIEMVYVPQGAFAAGSGGTENDAFYKYPTTTNAFQVTSENAINVGTTVDYLSYPNNYNGGDRGGPIPAAFPKGYDGFYCQKYEISQQQYVDFLNTLTQTQADTRKYTESFFRYAITGNTVGGYATTNPFVACNFLTWMDGAAYSDWAGLRPMTELEYEKACRGTAAPVANEYAWGTATVAASTYSLSNATEANEDIATNYSTTAGNAGYYATYSDVNGPLRVGIFAANSSNTGRITAGASYYGVMELSGNLWERTVSVGSPTGRAYTGLHGNGVLSTAGHADVTVWPGLSGSEVTVADGSGYRGGGWGNDAVYMRASDRHEATYTYTGRYDYSGFRAVRTQPLPKLTTTEATLITTTTASSGGNVTSDGGGTITARGICWSTSTGPTTALITKTTETGTTGVFTSNITGLTASTLYYVRAYATNSAGTAYGNEVSFTTSLTCGSTFTKNHIAGTVAPVTKSVTYGTVSTTLFGGTKCAITRNLGATNQASSANDGTEASAGWYWQFNKKQGYKHTGASSTTILTPSWTITSINETSDWIAANDPCTLEFGNGWRLPTNAEWTSADGSWSNITDAWNSVLKLHAAGFLDTPDGSLSNRGPSGHYWSSTQYDASNGWRLRFDSGNSDMGSSNKAFGFTARCLRDLSPTLTTTDASVIGATTATSGGNITAQNASAVTARGICWSTSAVPTIALSTKTSDGTGTGAFTSSLTGLFPSTLYHIRAYATNTEGTSYGEDKTFTTTAFVCGTSVLTANHYVTNGVAPVDKSVSYGTVSTTLFGGTKCAITQNLGADHQATAVSDATEASAGWYWQFNRKQGYKADCANGSTCYIPSSPAWNTLSDNLSATWEAAKDPCTLELGSGWRIPTNTEWSSASGSWTNWTGPWSSVLKLHAAGDLNSSDGSLGSRGSSGGYWSSTQYSASNGWGQWFVSVVSTMSTLMKMGGFSVRCLKDLSPTLTTTDASVIGANTATAGGNITAQNASEVTARGVCWSTSANPTKALSTKTTNGTGTGIFTSSLTGLLPSTLYHIRAYATNTEGTNYGEDKTFTTTVCFIAGTKISMADGSLKNIEEIVVGDEVGSVNTETLEIVTQTVTNTFANPPAGNLSKITFSNGQTNTNTKNHPYWVVGKGWSCIDPEAYTASKAISTSLLEIGDQCLFIENGNLVLVSISTIEDQTELTVPTFNFKVNQTNCYFANGVLVHNKP